MPATEEEKIIKGYKGEFQDLAKPEKYVSKVTIFIIITIYIYLRLFQSCDTKKESSI